MGKVTWRTGRDLLYFASPADAAKFRLACEPNTDTLEKLRNRIEALEKRLAAEVSIDSSSKLQRLCSPAATMDKLDDISNIDLSGLDSDHGPFDSSIDDGIHDLGPQSKLPPGSLTSQSAGIAPSSDMDTDDSMHKLPRPLGPNADQDGSGPGYDRTSGSHGIDSLHSLSPEHMNSLGNHPSQSGGAAGLDTDLGPFDSSIDGRSHDLGSQLKLPLAYTSQSVGYDIDITDTVNRLHMDPRLCCRNTGQDDIDFLIDTPPPSTGDSNGNRVQGGSQLKPPLACTSQSVGSDTGTIDSMHTLPRLCCPSPDHGTDAVYFDGLCHKLRVLIDLMEDHADAHLKDEG